MGRRSAPASVHPTRRWAVGALAALAIAVTPACSLLPPVGGCSEIGCANQVTFVADVALEPGGRYRVEACVGRRCRSATVRVPTGVTEDMAVGRGDLSVSVDDATVELLLSDGDDGSTREATVRIVDDRGTVIVEGGGQAEFGDPYRPNGPWCPPVCRRAEIVV